MGVRRNREVAVATAEYSRVGPQESIEGEQGLTMRRSCSRYGGNMRKT
jgi:hypothetical protein